MNYYNEWDKTAAAWLRELIHEELIPHGEVDTRDIALVQPDELKGFTQAHFFAGIGGWSLALKLAGWPRNRSVWTGSCPCQPFSIAGEKRAGEDNRDLWPIFSRLIRESRPDIIFGEQVATAVKWGWYDRLCDDLEANGYACGACCLQAACVGAAHERERLFWVAANPSSAGRERRKHVERTPLCEKEAFTLCGDTPTLKGSPLAGRAIGLLHRDGLPVRVARSSIKGYGNAIVPQAAAAFIAACPVW
ncbi:MAG: DNA cytosine methyltransferase [Bryobacteraceae bacterium]